MDMVQIDVYFGDGSCRAGRADNEQEQQGKQCERAGVLQAAVPPEARYVSFAVTIKHSQDSLCLQLSP